MVETPASNAALLSGQICDGIATPIVGYISDTYNTRWGNYLVIKVKELPGIFLVWFSSSVATSPFTRASSHPITEELSMLITPSSLVFSTLDGLLYRSVT